MNHNLKTYLVGGAVRDFLLNKPIKDRDYVVVGSSQKEMLDLGFEQVGQGFPVFLHPETREEYALARAEEKVGSGYTGFEFNTDGVTLEDDLSRRDFTINSMALTANEELIDPYGGQQDLEAGILRHTSRAFIEDPLRVIRLARFHARYGFSVADETFEMCKEMVDLEDLNSLSVERFWTEIEKAFSDGKQTKFFRMLFDLGVLNRVKFFVDLIGPNCTEDKLDYLCGVAEQVKPYTLELQLDLFAALVGQTTAVFKTARAKRIFENLELASAAPQTVEGLYKVMTKAKAWSESSEVFDLQKALICCENLKMPRAKFTAYTLIEALGQTRLVSAAKYIHLEGRAIGEAMKAERIQNIITAGLF